MYIEFINLIDLLALSKRFIARPFCQRLGIEDKPRKEPEPNAICEKVFKTVTKRPDENVIKGLCNQLGWTEFQVRLWFTRRRNISKLPVMRKATESWFVSCYYHFVDKMHSNNTFWYKASFKKV